MGDELSEHSSACHKNSCEILWVPIMPGTQMLWIRDFFIFIFEHSITLCWEDACQQHMYNLLWVQKDEKEQGLLIQ
jgi:hypothetical protein